MYTVTGPHDALETFSLLGHTLTLLTLLYLHLAELKVGKYLQASGDTGQGFEERI